MKWIICIGGSDYDGCDAYIYEGTVEQTKALLVHEIEKLREVNEEDDWHEYDYGTDKVEDVFERYNGNLYAYACFDNFHVDVEAIPANNVKDYSKRWNEE